MAAVSSERIIAIALLRVLLLFLLLRLLGLLMGSGRQRVACCFLFSPLSLAPIARFPRGPRGCSPHSSTPPEAWQLLHKKRMASKRHPQHCPHHPLIARWC